ncbi:MAG: hypothetical protein HFH32_07210 [Eubacterium sp.]|jgi:hypothetical protein|nr:hypothetical protein [Eubacterium sp.]
MGITVVKKQALRVIDTFAARELHELQTKPAIDTLIDYGVRAECSLNSVDKRRENEIET